MEGAPTGPPRDRSTDEGKQRMNDLFLGQGRRCGDAHGQVGSSHPQSRVALGAKERDVPANLEVRRERSGAGTLIKVDRVPREGALAHEAIDGPEGLDVQAVEEHSRNLLHWTCRWHEQALSG